MSKTPNVSPKVREVGLRNRARRQGLVLRRSRRRDPAALSFGTYQLASYSTGDVVFGGTADEDYFGMTLDQVETFLSGTPANSIEAQEIEVSGLKAILRFVNGYPMGLQRRNGWLLETVADPTRVYFIEAAVEDQDEVARHSLDIVAIWRQGGH